MRAWRPLPKGHPCEYRVARRSLLRKASPRPSCALCREYGLKLTSPRAPAPSVPFGPPALRHGGHSEGPGAPPVTTASRRPPAPVYPGARVAILRTSRQRKPCAAAMTFQCARAPLYNRSVVGHCGRCRARLRDGGQLHPRVRREQRKHEMWANVRISYWSYGDRLQPAMLERRGVASMRSSILNVPAPLIVDAVRPKLKYPCAGRKGELAKIDPALR
ncbi:hypothetical protein AWB81_04403 [Caballeronia arationis]|jgi:hypothetical protein|uniref:Uncharacterized protein n=1 Tax=Caballeronia arationis TaxID=1777142 RepID=A0A7Z7IEM7_9BURK|nr:hypothetical protein AWB81_04403 [Caballeronia arationis]SOE89538.1 hypothetical protein SAMN05446927_8059 [Caballeronia arationis]